jgi:hypothetical protein
LYLKDSRPSRSILFAQLREIQVASHMTPGTPATHNASAVPCLRNPSRNTTPARIPFNAGINRSGPSSVLVGRIPCFRGRKYALYAVKASDVMAKRDICEGIMINMSVGTSESKANDFYRLK